MSSMRRAGGNRRWSTLVRAPCTEAGPAMLYDPDIPEPVQVRYRCRNPRCGGKLKAPAANPRDAFCCTKCEAAYYRIRCRCCEQLFSRKTQRREVCGRSRCRHKFQRHPERFWGSRYPRQVLGHNAEKSLAKSTPKQVPNRVEGGVWRPVWSCPPALSRMVQAAGGKVVSTGALRPRTGPACRRRRSPKTLRSSETANSPKWIGKRSSARTASDALSLGFASRLRVRCVRLHRSFRFLPTSQSDFLKRT
jgi:hypothetical protein